MEIKIKNQSKEITFDGYKQLDVISHLDTGQQALLCYCLSRGYSGKYNKAYREIKANSINLLLAELPEVAQIKKVVCTENEVRICYSTQDGQLFGLVLLVQDKIGELETIEAEEETRKLIKTWRGNGNK